jgi:hypothetical protein
MAPSPRPPPPPAPFPPPFPPPPPFSYPPAGGQPLLYFTTNLPAVKNAEEFNVTLRAGGALLGRRAAGPLGCRDAGMLGCWDAGLLALPGCRAARLLALLGCRAAGLLGCRAAGLLGCWAAGAAGLLGRRAAGLLADVAMFMKAAAWQAGTGAPCQPSSCAAPASRIMPRPHGRPPRAGRAARRPPPPRAPPSCPLQDQYLAIISDFVEGASPEPTVEISIMGTFPGNPTGVVLPTQVALLVNDTTTPLTFLYSTLERTPSQVRLAGR